MLLKKIIFLLAIILYIFACKKKQPSPVVFEQSNFDKGESFAFKNNDSAFYYLNKATTIYKDSLEAAMAYNYMAAIQSDAGDYFGAQENLLSSLKFLNEKKPENFACLASDYNELGLNNFNLKNYQAALVYYNSALKYTKNEDFRLTILNNEALVYQELKNYAQTIKIYDSIIPNVKKNKTAYARALTNISFTKWLKDPGYNPEPMLLIALHIREKENNDFGRNSSYAHLADYYLQKQTDKALFYANKMYQVAQKIESPDDQLQALQKLIKLSPQKEARQYFEIYQNLSDSLQTARSAAKNQFALIRYETEKSKADNLVLQKDNEEKKYQIVILAFGILLLAVAGTLWYRKRKQRLELEAQNSIRENKLKTSQKVHDVVANGLYRIMNKLDNQRTLKDNPIIDEIEELYEQSRDLSYEKPKSKNLAFQENISELLKTFASDDTKVIIVGNSAQLWEKVSDQVKYEIEHVLQEMMVNMDKHSQASDVVIRFEQAQQKINIYYTDNGIGISDEVQFQNGLTSTGNRIEGIDGTITFDTKVEKGLKIQVSFPVS